MKRSVVCISHATGSGGNEVGRLVAERLGLSYVDEELVARAAAKGGVESGEIADEERRKSRLARVLDEMSLGTGAEAWAMGGFIPPVAGAVPTSEDLRAFIREAIEETAARGDVVIVAHAASHAIGPREDALRVLVTASPETRASRVAEGEGVDEAAAAHAVKEADAARADYLRRFHDVREELPTQYDLVLNTDLLSPEQAAALISAAAAG
ncbi:MAG TPA: cytidylate kinase-like family protein [Gaiellales bacterium]|nr:cytidylate kinase-like family protein [Gaiellales bacterium]